MILSGGEGSRQGDLVNSCYLLNQLGMEAVQKLKSSQPHVYYIGSTNCHPNKCSDLVVFTKFLIVRKERKQEF